MPGKGKQTDRKVRTDDRSRRGKEVEQVEDPTGVIAREIDGEAVDRAFDGARTDAGHEKEKQRHGPAARGEKREKGYGDPGGACEQHGASADSIGQGAAQHHRDRVADALRDEDGPHLTETEPKGFLQDRDEGTDRGDDEPDDEIAIVANVEQRSLEHLFTSGPRHCSVLYMSHYFL